VIRALYSLALVLAQPFMRAKLRRRAIAEPGYGHAMGERFGDYQGLANDSTGGPGFIWVHAVSLGETRAAAILVAQLRLSQPGMRLLLTHGTATGRAEGASLLQKGDVQVWQPWDTPSAVGKFLAIFKPRIGILMETEVWPNLVAACQRRGIPLVLANARLSEKSLRQSLKLAWLARPAYRALTAVWAQTAADAARLTQLGAPVAGVFGNLKFDATPQAEQLAQGQAWRGTLTRPVILLASSREGEEAALLRLLKENSSNAVREYTNIAINNIATQSLAQVQWLIVPRHPQRFDAVAALIEHAGFTVSRRSQWGGNAPPLASAPGAAQTVWLGDSLGEMSLYYGLADVALLGGSFEPLGGQNLIEAAACACPLVMGPHTFNFAEAAQLAEDSGVAWRAADLAQASVQALALVNDPAALQAARTAAQTFTRAHRGATAKLAQAIDNLLAHKP
jgi:3-deoxy-D-manno-octulosonic-acid transferase